MDSLEHLNGGSQGGGAGHADGTGEIVAAIHADGELHPASNLQDTAELIGARLHENLRALSSHLGMVDRFYQERAQQIAALQDQVSGIEQELQNVQNFVRGLPQDVQTVREQCDGKLQSLEQSLSSGAQTVAGLAQQVTGLGEQLGTTSRTLDDKAGQISSLEISVAALIRDASKMATVETAIAELNQKGGELATTVEDLVQRSRSLRRLTVLTSATALILAVIVGVQMLGGWPAVARYVALLRSVFI